ncbi:MAG TPA: Asp-tRNA(Asn)/Glu-tRNA(Gln) amidotransferase subunit GatC [Patescibacteria group bacterium]|nr:Asp-tRNA(Asn)/Glu-tRNA(Gln) amidotransferase subunit GatC [Patescibacteria group bacterium]
MKIDVLHIAKLANLPLRKEEIKKYEEQLSAILEYIEKLKQVKTDDVPETSQTTGLENVTRDDSTTPSLTQTEALSNTKNSQKGTFKVKAIFEQ